MPMARVIAVVRDLFHEDEGQDLVEYGLLAVLIAVFVLAGMSQVGQAITNVFWQPIAQNF
jgi:Flp pilus assembly pilin Flp